MQTFVDKKDSSVVQCSLLPAPPLSFHRTQTLTTSVPEVNTWDPDEVVSDHEVDDSDTDYKTDTADNVEG